MRRCRRDQDDGLARQHPAIAMDDQARLQRPARVRFRLDLGELLLGHPGIVLERHGGDGGVGMIAHQPDEAGERADIGAPGGERREFGTDVEGFALDPDHRACARRAPSAAGHRREEGDLVAGPYRIGWLRVVLVDRRPHHARASPAPRRNRAGSPPATPSARRPCSPRAAATPPRSPSRSSRAARRSRGSSRSPHRPRRAPRPARAARRVPPAWISDGGEVVWRSPAMR